MPGKAARERNVLTSLVFIAPLFVAYHVGVLFTRPLLNGADFVTTFLFSELGFSDMEYLAFVVGVGAVLALSVLLLRKRQALSAQSFVPMLLESAVFAATMGALIIFVMVELLGISPGLAGGAGGLHGQSAFTRLIMSIGAGLYEEVVFRLGFLAGSIWFLSRALGLRRWIAVPCGFAFSSLLFSAMHHIPPHGDPLSLGVFTFRALAGGLFGLIFWFRGLATAVYTHAFYDVFVLLIR